MKSCTRFIITLFITFSTFSNLLNAQEMLQPNTACFIGNEGQIADGKGNLHPEVLFKSSFNDVTMFFKNNGIVYLFSRYDKVPTEESMKARSIGEIARANVLETKPMMFRMDLQFLNTNPDVAIVPSGKHQEVSNYYLAHCPQGILNVSHFDKITYKNIYQNIDLVYYYTANGLKYDIVVNPGGNISDIKFKYEGANKVYLAEDGQLNIVFADEQKLIEEKPVAFFENEKENKQNIQFIIDKASGIIGISGPENTFQNTLIIDPSITWATYFHNTNSANSGWTNTEYDASGNFFMADQTYDHAFPLANPGGGAYYDATITTMIKVVVLKFSAARALIWSTYYGGDNYDCLAGCTDYGKALALDNSGNVYVAGYTTSVTTVFPTYNPGGGAWYQDQTKINGETSFFLKFSNSGVRQWATMYQYAGVVSSWSGFRINGIHCDGTSLFFTGETYGYNPIPLFNPGGSAYYQPTFAGNMDAFVGKFNSSLVMVWGTYINSGVVANKAYAAGLDLHTDANGNLFVAGRETSNSGPVVHHLIVNPGGGAFMQATANGSQNIEITKFNSSLTAVWSTYYGGNGMDIPSTVEPDGAGNIYIVGRVTQSTTFPTLNPGGGALYQAAKSNAASDGFLLKFNATTCARNWATYLGSTVPNAGSDENHFYGLAFNTSNNHVFVMGDTPSLTIATLNKAGSYNQAAKGGGTDMFFYEFDNAGVTQWASYYGGTGNESFYNGRFGYHMTGCGLQMLAPIGTATQTLTTVDPGGGDWYQSSTTFTWNDFMLELSDASSPLAVSVSIAASVNPICAGTSVTFTATPTNGGTPSYQWYLNGSPVGSNSSTYTNPSLGSGDQVYCIMTSSLTCITGNPATSNTITMTVNTNSVAPTSISATVNPICIGNSTTLSVVGGSLGTGAVWNWYTGGCGTTMVGTGSSISVTPGVNTTYYVLAQGTCDTTTCVSLAVNINIVNADAGTTQTICTGASATLTATGGGTYLWSELAQTTASITVSPVANTTYSVTVYNGGCSATDQVTVNVTTNADATITPAGPYCLTASPVNLTAIDPGGIWTGTGITNVLLGTFDPSIAGVGTFQIIYAIPGSCGDSDTVMISVTNNLNATINPAGPYCSNSPPVILTAIDTGGTWSGSGITNTTTGQFSPALVGVGSYQVIYTISGSCGDADTVIVVVNIAANATINAAGPYCVSDNAVTLTAAQTGGTWSGTGITNTSTGAFDPGTAGVGSHVITYIISGACADTGTVTIVVNSLANATITPAGPYCLNNIPVTLTAATSGGVWTGGGITNASSGLFNPSIAGVGPHTIIYTISGNCGNADTISITVYDIPEGSATATGETCIGANDGTGSISVSGGLSPYTYSWSGGQTTQSVSNLPPDIYTVTILDAHGCAITDTAEVIASTTPCETYIPHIYVPNIFSPNGDGQNDVLYVRGKGVKELEFVVYDRWGEKVFETTDMNYGWDGKYKEKDMDAAVFVYYLKATLDSDEKVDIKGNVTLIR